MIEKGETDETNLAEAAEEDEAMDSQEKAEEPMDPEDEAEQLTQVLSRMEALHLGAEATAGVRARLAEIRARSSPQTSLASSITLRMALKNTRDIHEKAAKKDTRDIEAAQEALQKAQERLSAATDKRDARVVAFRAEEAKLLTALQKAEADTAPAAAKSGGLPSSIVQQGALSTAELLDKVVALSCTEHGRAALAMRGLSTAPATSHSPMQFPATQEGTQEPTELEIERLVSTLPPHLHAGLAKRLVQPGVLDNQHRPKSAAEAEREAAAAKEAAARATEQRQKSSEGSVRSNSRSPRRGGENA